MNIENAAVFSKKTALDHYEEKSKGEQLNEEDWEAIKAGHREHYNSLDEIETSLEDRGIDYRELSPPYSSIDDDYDLCIVAGGDGTLLDAHPYIDDTYTVTVNTDEKRSDGGLHKFGTEEFEPAIDSIPDDDFETEEWTRIEGIFEDSREIALNEIFVGPDHTGNTAEYRIEHGELEESHRNSGMIISTGRGSTGWYTNIHEDIYGEPQSHDPESEELYYITWHDMDGAESPAGTVEEGEVLHIKSEMNYDGKVKFDGNRRIQDFPRGREVEVKAAEPLRVVV